MERGGKVVEDQKVCIMGSFITLNANGGGQSIRKGVRRRGQQEPEVVGSHPVP